MSVDVAAYVGLGGNAGGAAAVRQRIEAAVAAMSSWPWVASVRCSRQYVSAPLGPVVRQPPFVNGVVELVLAAAAPPPLQLLIGLRAIETSLGRERAHEVAQGPRTIDLDLLLVGALELRDPGPPSLALPHPRLGVRKFVLRPLHDLTGPLLPLPGWSATVGERLADPGVACQRVEPLGLWF